MPPIFADVARRIKPRLYREALRIGEADENAYVALFTGATRFEHLMPPAPRFLKDFPGEGRGRVEMVAVMARSDRLRPVRYWVPAFAGEASRVVHRRIK